jgi:hypothetical protein
MVGIPKRHHVVPKFYLKRFASKAGDITAFHPENFRRYTTSVENVGVEGHFYNIPTEDGWDTIVEETLSKLESIAAIDLAKLADGRSSTMQAFRTKLSFFMAVQFVRGRRPRYAMTDLYKQLFKKVAQFSTPQMIQAELKRQGEQITLEEATKIAAVGQDPSLQVELPADALINAAEIFRHGEQLIPYFYQRGWTVLEFDDPVLLTSDEPVAAGVVEEAPQMPTGVGNADSIVFPLDPNRALLMMRPDIDNVPHKRAKGTPELATLINQMVALRAAKQVFFHPDTDPLTPIIPKDLKPR